MTKKRRYNDKPVLVDELIFGPNLDIDNINTIFNISAYEKTHATSGRRSTNVDLGRLTETAKKNAQAKNQAVLDSLKKETDSASTKATAQSTVN